MTTDEYRRTLAQGEDVTFRAHRGSGLFMLFLVVVLTLGALVMITSDNGFVEVLGWMGLVLFGVLGIPRAIYITIRPEGMLKVSAQQGVWFLERGGFWIPWNAISSVEVGKINRQDTVALQVDPELSGLEWLVLEAEEQAEIAQDETLWSLKLGEWSEKDLQNEAHDAEVARERAEQAKRGDLSYELLLPRGLSIEPADLHTWLATELAHRSRAAKR